MGDTVGYWPLVVLLIGIAAVILQIVVFRIQAFIALVLSAILVAMIVTSGITAALLKSVVLPYHSICIYMAIGYGSMTVSWMNDSAFWVVSEMSGFTVPQPLNSWTPTLAIMPVLGLIQALLFSFILPLV
ncbi:MAG: hypothetical protein IIC50_13960 [Planctomycetes bacterium]|nr:hypothetical protein [Planctomycetota bacterium]